LKRQKNPELGIEALDENGTEFKEERIVTLQHYENYDGSGYPYGFAKEEIHLCGKIARINRRVRCINDEKIILKML
jgi:HD-GYP domain